MAGRETPPSCARTLGGFENVPKPFIIGVSGGTASGKSSVCSKIVQELGEDKVSNRQRSVVVLSQDSFYRDLNTEETEKAYKGSFNFDHPDALDAELLVNTLNDIKAGKTVSIPEYSFKTHSRQVNKFLTVYPADVVLFEGILVFYWKELREMFNMKLFVDTDPDTRLARRVLRDTKDRGRELDQVLHQYTNYVKPAFEEFCLPTKKYADVIIPRGADNIVAIDLIVQHIQELLRPKRKQNGHKPELKRLESDSGLRSRPH